MIGLLRDALNEKLEEQRNAVDSCVIEWIDSKEIQVVAQRYMSLAPLEKPKVNEIYTIFLDITRRYGKVLYSGTKEQCESFLKKHTPNRYESSAVESDGDKNPLSELILIQIIERLINLSRPKMDEINDEDIHHVKCDGCGESPLIQVDRYRCLECSSSSKGYDLCGRCFETRRQTEQHRTGHAMIHFKLPNEFLGIEFESIREPLNLDTVKRISKLVNEQHNGITCDGQCGKKNFIGLCFKCDVCPNYHLCYQCAIDRRSISKIHQRDHPMILTSSRVMPSISPDDIKCGEGLGRGAFGYVCRAKWLSKNRDVACKVIEVSAISAESKRLEQSFLSELAAYRELSGPYILRIFGYSIRKLPDNGFQRAMTQYMILMEFMSRGSLRNLLEQASNQLSLRRKLTMARQIASGMRRIHQHGMIHRDIRPDNILVNEKYIAKIGDMGIARVLDPVCEHTQMGCLAFMPPEFFEDTFDGKAHFDEKLDIYTYGLTLNQLLTETMHEFRLNAPSRRMNLKKRSPILYDEIIGPALDDDPKRRPTAEFIEKTLQTYEELFSQTMLTKNYMQMNTREKDQVFRSFYETNRRRIQHILSTKLPSSPRKEIQAQIQPSANRFLIRSKD